jgi:hypothetical protein
MKKNDRPQKEKPATVAQIVAAMKALDMYDGENTEAEHRVEAARLGGETYYHMMLVNALLGGVEANALMADASGVTADQMDAAHRQALVTAGMEDDPKKLMSFLRWRTLRVGGQLRKIAQNREVGPLPLSAAHAAEALQLILTVCASGQNLTQADPVQMLADLRAARESLSYSLANLDLMLGLVEQVKKRF